MTTEFSLFDNIIQHYDKSHTSSDCTHSIDFETKCCTLCGLQLDNEIMKHFNDCIFYKHTMKNSRSETARFVAESRYEISSDKTRQLKDKLDYYIFR